MMADDRKKEDSVYDYLYVDLKRIAQFSSQLNQYGHLTSLTRSVSENSSSTGSLGIAQTKIDKVASEQTGQVRQFDPQWLNPLTFLDDLSRRDLIKRDVLGANLGQFVLTRGQLLLYDLEMLRGAWDKPHIKKLIKAGLDPVAAVSGGSRAERRAHSRKQDEQQNDQFQVFMDVLGIIPHGLQIRLLDGEISVWSTLDTNFVTGNPGDLILKHGALIGGEWNIVGIKDADMYDPQYKHEDGRSEEDIAAEVAGTAVGQVAARIGIAARNVSGRPGLAIGVTPILIFREIS